MATKLRGTGVRGLRWVALVWLGFALFDAGQTVGAMRSEGMRHPWLVLFAVTAVSWLPWALATPLVLRLGRRYPPVRWRSPAGWFAHLGACSAIALTFYAWSAWLEICFNPYADSPPPGFARLWSDKISNGLLTSLVLYALVLIVQYALDSRERIARARTEAARLNEQLSLAQLAALRRQIEPHFLFNTLSAVSGLIREGRGGEAVSTIAGLSDFLRRTLAESDRREVQLREEMDFVENYLDIAKIRFAERLQLYVDVPPDLYPASVPNLILQPLVENAVVHGISKRSRGGAIEITASQCNGMLELTVCNDGPSLPADWERASGGIGMANVRTRLQTLYGSAFELRMQNRATGGVAVLLSLPLRSCPVAP